MPQTPITKDSLVNALRYDEANKDRRKPLSWWVARIKKYHVDFQPTFDDELEIRHAAPHFSDKDLNELIKAISANGKRPVAGASSPSPTGKDIKDEAKISGKMNEVYFQRTESGFNFLVIMNLHIQNDGRPTKIQEFELQVSFDNHPYTSKPASCTTFQVMRWENNVEVAHKILPDLRDLNDTPFERHFPRDGWLCFEVNSRLTTPDFENEYARRLLDLTVVIKDGINVKHLVAQKYPFPGTAKLAKPH
jgi:hypothetical protein